MSTGWHLRWRDDASGYVAPFAGKLASVEPFATVAEAEEIRRAAPNGVHLEVVPACETCAGKALKPAHNAPTEGHQEHCGCVRCFG